MPKLTVETRDHQAHFRPGEVVAGFCGWECDAPPRWAELRLFWYTQGRGTRDTGIVATQRWDDPPAVDAPLFEFTLPAGPYSCSGQLVSIAWALELVVKGVDDVARLDLVVAPAGREVEVTAEVPS